MELIVIPDWSLGFRNERIITTASCPGQACKKSAHFIRNFEAALRIQKKRGPALADSDLKQFSLGIDFLMTHPG
jgi:hypothetical protein